MAQLARAQPWLGTIVEIRAEHADMTMLIAAVDKAFAVIARVHKLMSVHAPDSELSQLNAHAHVKRMAIADEMRAVLSAALDLAEQSHGVFDPTIGDKLARVGRLPRWNDANPCATWRDVDLDEQGVYFTTPLIMDFGGIAKGYAVDCALTILRDADCLSATVNAGGDLARFGSVPEPIHVRDPRGGYLHILALQQGAVATSCYAGARTKHDGRWTTPLVDPRTHLCAMTAKSATVSAPVCMVADALTKIVLLLGTGSRPLLQRYHASAVTLAMRGSSLSLGQIPPVPHV